MKTEEESIERTIFSAFYLEILRNKKKIRRRRRKSERNK